MNTALKMSLWRCHRDLARPIKGDKLWDLYAAGTSIYGTLKLIEWLAMLDYAALWAAVVSYFTR